MSGTCYAKNLYFSAALILIGKAKQQWQQDDPFCPQSVDHSPSARRGCSSRISLAMLVRKSSDRR